MRKETKKQFLAKMDKNRRKREKKEKIPEEIKQPSPVKVRHLLVLEYNQLVRKGDPATKELREQIHEQITEIENA